jgi:hypothetical protein
MHDRASAAIEVRIPDALLPATIRNLPVPALLPVRSRRSESSLVDPRASVRRALGARLDEDGAADLRGRRVGLGLGSRGLGAYPELVAGALDALRSRGAVPVLLPAMGSHGGGTPEGQTAVLRDYGLLQDGVELDASDATREVGRSGDGTPLHASEAALRLDRIVILNRVKSHTSFRAPVESGLAKMLVIGLGKRPGATALHARGYEGFADRLMAARDRLLDVYPRPTFVAIVEDAEGRPAHVEALLGHEIVEREPQLLLEAKRRMARLPFAKLDLLVVERAGKDVSGLGMDPNVTGRHPDGDRTPPDPTRIALLSLTDASEGNANGMGLADVVPRAFADRIDPVATWTNVVASTSLAAARLPVVVPTRADAVRLALATCGVAPADARIAWIEDTGRLDAYRVSPAALASLQDAPSILEVTGPAAPAPLEAA